MELIFCNFSKREKRAEQNRGRRSQRKGGGRECVKKKKRGRNKWEKPGRGRRGRRNERSQAELFWTCYTTPPPPRPLLSETCWHVDVASGRKRWGRERKVNTREERNGGWWWLEAGERKEK